MSISLLHGCFQIELTVRELGAWRSFMEQVLGAAPIDQRLAEELRGVVPPGFDIDEIDCGQATFQPNQPAPMDGYRAAHQRYLEEVGPCVTNLNYYVDDVFHAKRLLTGLGAVMDSEGPSTLIQAMTDYGPDNTRPGADERPYLFIGTRHLFGFDLEILEPNFEHFAEQDVQLPCFYGERPGDGVDGLRLQRLTVVVPDLEATHANIVEVFTPGSRSEPRDVQQGSHGRSFRISLGGIELEYCEPSAAGGPLADQLQRFGSGVIEAVFGLPSVDSVLERLASYPSVEVTQRSDVLGTPGPSTQWVLACRESAGFDIVLVEADERRLLAS
jgi:hypothetical protein